MEAAAEAFIDHEFDWMRCRQRLRVSDLEQWRDAPGLDGSAMWITAEEIRQIHDEVWPIAAYCPERAEDPSRRAPEACADPVFSCTGVSLQR
jgi:hypothetical protein